MKSPFLLGLVLFLIPTTLHAQESAWSGTSWIWDQPDANNTPQDDEPRYLRRSFELTKTPTKAVLKITADNQYIAYINGIKIGEDSSWNSVESYDVAKHLVVGKNVLAIMAANQGGVAGVIARLQIEGSDAKRLIIGTDAKTKVSLLLQPNWNKSEFEDSKWSAAVVLGDASIAPWNLTGAGATAASGSKEDVSAVDPKVKARLSAEEQLKHFTFPKGFELELVVADPQVINPVTMTVDDKGRIYVSESHTYRYGPSGSPIKPYANPVVRLDPIEGGKYRRTLVADGFDDPVMGIALKDNKLWLTANNFLYTYDLTEDGKAINKKTILIDKNKAWNPFGMFVLEWGPDGLLYLSVGDHKIDIQGPDGSITGRANSGIIMRMQPDGTKMQRLVHGMRVPYSFEYDPFGQLWVLSNGEGNPNRFLRVIDGVDYQCYSRPGVDNNWLAGNHPLAPPCFESLRGAHTQLMRYYGSAFPEEYQGSLFLCNWGAHGFSGPNRAIFRYVPDDKGKIGIKESLLSCTDPHFRPSHIGLDPEGNLLVADWYGRDDESDMTGRIWRLKYTGEHPKNAHSLSSKEWAQPDFALSALASPNHLAREKACEILAKQGNANIPALSEIARTSKSSLGAAQALWTLARVGTPEAKVAFAAGSRHSDAKVRRLAVDLARRYDASNASEIAKQLRSDADPAVQVMAARALTTSEEIRSALVDALSQGAAHDVHLRYEAAWHLAKHTDRASLTKLLAANDDDLRLAAMIAIDVACFENFASKPAALAALSAVLEQPGKADLDLLLMLAQLDGDESIVPALQKLLTREDLPASSIGRTVLVLRAKVGSSSPIGAAAGKRLLDAVEKKAIKISSPSDQLVLLELLEIEGATPFALSQVAGMLRSNQAPVRQAAHGLVRRFGPKATALADNLWFSLLDPRTKSEEAVEQLATLARIEAKPSMDRWQKLLVTSDPMLRTEAVRWWRSFKGNGEMVDILVKQTPALLKSDPNLRDDLSLVLRQLELPASQVTAMDLPTPETDKDALTKLTLAEFAKLPEPERKKRATLGLQVFERAACTKCHTTATQTTLLAPSLKGIAAQKIDYLIESVLFPSKIIKTGFESETITTKQGQVLTGLVKDEGKFLRVLNLDRDLRIAKTDVDERSVQRVSIMPEGQEALLSRREFADLIAYMMTLK